MLKRSILLTFITCLLLGCVHHAPKPASSPVVPGTTMGKSPQTRSLPAFNRVVVNGGINVKLYTGASHSYVVLRGDPRDLVQILTRVNNNTLMVLPGGGFPKFGAVLVEIHTRYLNAFTYKGGGSIEGPNINSGLLDLSISNAGRTRLGGNIHLRKLEVDGPGYTEIHGVNTNGLQLSLSGKARVQLVGVANIANLDLSGDGWFGLYWVKSNSLTIRARGHTVVQLAGIANKLDVELWDYARFNGRYLRAKTTFAKTHNHSVAEITVIDKQHTLATDASDIYFYKIPEMKSNFMAYNGAVLDMRGWNPDVVVKDYTRYNK